MATEAVRVRKHSAVLPVVAIFGAWMVLTSGGCAHRYYEGGDLPPELVAPVTQNVDATLVSRLIRHKSSSEMIDVGDLLEVTIDTGYGEQEPRTTPVWVAEDGTARVPLIGPVAVRGLSLQDASQAIAYTAIQRQLYRDPYITVEMKQQRMNKITVMGPVKDQGVVELPRGNSTLVAALVAAGNLTENAGPDVEIRRPASGNAVPGAPGQYPPQVADGSRTELASYEAAGQQTPTTTNVNLASISSGGSEDYHLDDGDFVVVSEREPRSIHVMGLVRKPDQYDLPVDQDRRVLDALSMAGGRTSQLANKVWVIRQGPNQAEPVRIRVDVRKAKADGAANVRLAANDVVSVEETPVTFLLDVLKGFVRVGLSSAIPLD